MSIFCLDSNTKSETAAKINSAVDLADFELFVSHWPLTDLMPELRGSKGIPLHVILFPTVHHVTPKYV